MKLLDTYRVTLEKHPMDKYRLITKVRKIAYYPRDIDENIEVDLYEVFKL
jgi:hypothetical protein